MGPLIQLDSNQLRRYYFVFDSTPQQSSSITTNTAVFVYCGRCKPPVIIPFTYPHMCEWPPDTSQSSIKPNLVYPCLLTVFPKLVVYTCKPPQFFFHFSFFHVIRRVNPWLPWWKTNLACFYVPIKVDLSWGWNHTRRIMYVLEEYIWCFPWKNSPFPSSNTNQSYIGMTDCHR